MYICMNICMSGELKLKVSIIEKVVVLSLLILIEMLPLVKHFD